MKRKISLLMSIVLMVCLFAAASGSVLASGKDISIPAGSMVAMAVNLDHTGEITGVDVVEGELPSGLAFAVEEGRLFLSGTAAASGDFKTVIRLQPWDARSEYTLRIRVRAADKHAERQPCEYEHEHLERLSQYEARGHKEREYQQTKRAIERIRVASGAA